jgi:glutamyl-tRNA reductase
MVVIESTCNRYELDVSHVNQEGLAEACAILHKMNFDKNFTFEVV